MRSLLFIVFFLVCTVCASAQKLYFIYLQSENSRSFYVKMSDKIYSSASSGYLILSNLVDSTYNFSIGFPSSHSESRFAVAPGGRDRGFLIKNLESGLGLFDLQTLRITNPQKEETRAISYQRRSDEFSFLLSKAANDTSLLYAVVRTKDVPVQNEQPKKEERKPKAEESDLLKDTAAAKPPQTNIALDERKQDTAAIQLGTESKNQGDVAAQDGDSKKNTIAGIEQKEQRTANAATTASGVDTLAGKTDSLAISPNATEEAKSFKRSQVKKHSESSTTEGFGLVFYDIYEGGQDTIRLLIPNPPIILKTTADPDSSLEQKDFIRVDELKQDTAKQGPVVVAIKNNEATSKCKAVASGNDFFRLRKNMASKTTDEAMVAEAKKVFRSKCFTTEQIKNLSSLFLTAAGKYQFFDAAYLHVSDQERFSSLESELKDDYYLKRFKVLIAD